MTALTFNQVKALKVGDRVSFPHGADMYPTFFFDERLDGTVNEVDINDRDDNMVWITLDTHKAELDEWDNQIQVYLYSEDELAFHIERLLNADDGTLDAFVLDYCATHNLDCDGDVFGVVFSGKTEFTESESAAIIEDAVGTYGLRR